MKERVRFSAYSLLITVAIVVLSVAGAISLRGDTHRLILLCVILGTAIVMGLYYCPVSVEAGESGITLRRLASRPRFFAYDDISFVDTCHPSAGGLRICGSGGAFGYWGYFSDIMIGTYFGYYGSRSHCFLIRLRNGRQYVIGCDGPVALTGFIRKHINA